jgi:hypothetical protein
VRFKADVVELNGESVRRHGDLVLKNRTTLRPAWVFTPTRRCSARTSARRVKLPRAESQAVTPISQDELDALLAAASPWFGSRPCSEPAPGCGSAKRRASPSSTPTSSAARCASIGSGSSYRARARRLRRAENRGERSDDPGLAGGAASIVAHLEVAGRRGRLASAVVEHHGAPVSAPKWEYEIRKARAAAVVRREISYHDLRHFYASALISAGCSVKAVQAALRHSSAKMTLDVYGHARPLTIAPGCEPSTGTRRASASGPLGLVELAWDSVADEHWRVTGPG